jgi:hypothetical protein
LDLVTVNQGKVGVLLGNGDGTFKRIIKYSPGGSAPSSVAIADLNGDGKPDILVLNNYGAVGVLLGNGDGRFQPPMTYYSAGGVGYGLAVGDLNGDGHPDLAVAGGTCPQDYCWVEGWCGCVSVMYNDGHGRFGASIFEPDGGYGSTYAVTIMNGSLIATNMCSDPWCDWPFGTVCCDGSCYASGGESPFALATRDLNGDGHFDIVVANSGDNPNVGVLLGDGVTFQPMVNYAPGNPYDVALGDVSGDGKADIVISNGYRGTGVLLGNGDGTFQTVVNFGWVGDILVLGDVNGDGKLDVIGTEGILLNHSGFLITTHLSSSLNPSFVNQSVTFTATVTSKHALIPDGELVNFYAGTRLLASVPLSGGTATYTTSTLSAETHIMKARYLGDTTFAPSAVRIEQVVQ